MIVIYKKYDNDIYTYKIIDKCMPIKNEDNDKLFKSVNDIMNELVILYKTRWGIYN